MPDPRWDALAEILIGHSTRLAAGETLLIECFDLEDNTLPRLLVQKAAHRGAYPLVETKDTRIVRELVRNASEPQMRAWGDYELHRMERVQAYIALRGARNINEMADVPGEKMDLYNTHYMKPVHFECRIKKTKWCVLRLPGASMAQQAGMSTEAFEDFYFDVCNLDYPRLAQALKPLAERMDRRRARSTSPGPGTDLRFSIKGIPVIPCAGEMNIPDGEVFTAPVRDSVEGHVRFNTPTIYQGSSFDGVRLEFQKGKIVAADCTGGDVKKLRRILATDEGAALHRRVVDRLQPPRPAPDARHPLRREDRRQLPPHARQRLRRGRQRQPLEDPLGPGADPAPRLRRRHNRLRRRADPRRRPLRPRGVAGPRPGVKRGLVTKSPGRPETALPRRLRLAHAVERMGRT